MHKETLPPVQRSLSKVVETENTHVNAKFETSDKSKVIVVSVPFYPPVRMPTPPAGYLKPRKYDFF
jgi:hypothetical protein